MNRRSFKVSILVFAILLSLSLISCDSEFNQQKPDVESSLSEGVGLVALYNAEISSSDEMYVADSSSTTSEWSSTQESQPQSSSNAEMLQSSDSSDSISIIVYITKTGRKYHQDGCEHLSKSKIPIPLDEALLSYDPCLVCEPPAPNAQMQITEETPIEVSPQSTIVYVTKTGSKYHRNGCKHLSKSKIPIDLESAKAGYGACSICNPPR